MDTLEFILMNLVYKELENTENYQEIHINSKLNFNSL
jgi:hypothetical protein